MVSGSGRERGSGANKREGNSKLEGPSFEEEAFVHGYAQTNRRENLPHNSRCSQ